MTRSPTHLAQTLTVALAATAALLLCGTASASAATFSNTTPIAVPAGAGPTGTSGPSSPYPSSITVSGTRGPVVEGSLEVTLNNVSHTFPQDLDILLVGPNGKGAILMSDACGTTDLVD